MKTTPIILASASKARSQILRLCGIPHKIKVSNVCEILDSHKGPGYNARINAYRKAQAVSSTLKRGYVIAADSLVLLGRRLVGKPKSKKEAKKLLRLFSGKTISLYTGLCVKDVGRNIIAQAVTVSKIKVSKLKSDEIDQYLKKLGPFDKAGGFSIEGVGSLIFDDIEGSFYNIQGLPTITLNTLFKKLGVELLDFIK